MNLALNEAPQNLFTFSTRVSIPLLLDTWKEAEVLLDWASLRQPCVRRSGLGQVELQEIF
jgi:hypothetical protein